MVGKHAVTCRDYTDLVVWTSTIYAGHAAYRDQDCTSVSNLGMESIVSILEAYLAL